MSPKEMIPLLPSHTHLLHRQLQIVFLRCVYWMPGAPRQRSWQQASHVVGKKKVAPPYGSRKCSSLGQLSRGENLVCMETALFHSYPPPLPTPGWGQVNCKQRRYNSHRQKDFFLIFPRLYDKRRYLLSKYDFCHISLRVFLCTHTWKQIASFISAKLQWLLPVIEAFECVLIFQIRYFCFQPNI